MSTPTTHTARPTPGPVDPADPADPVDHVVRRPFHTPVRGHGFTHRPAGGAPLPSGRLRLRREPGNPADPWAVAVWVEGGGVPWRAGYLERAVAARLGPRLDAAGGDASGRGPVTTVPAAFAGWSPSPDGHRQRPLVRIGADVADPRARPSVRDLPPYRRVRRWGAAEAVVS